MATYRISRVRKNASYGKSREIRAHKDDWEGAAETDILKKVRSKSTLERVLQEGGSRQEC